MHDTQGNGICCSNGRGAYSLDLVGGREVHESDGQFASEDVVNFTVVEDDIQTAASITESPSVSLIPTSMPSMMPSMMPSAAPSFTLSEARNISTITSEVMKNGRGETSFGILFDVTINSNSSSVTIMGVNLLIEAPYEVEYEVYSKPGSWQNVNETNPDYMEGFELVSNGVVNGTGTSTFSTIPLDQFENIAAQGGTQQAFYVTTKENTLRVITMESAPPVLTSTPEFEVLFGSSVMQYPLFGPAVDPFSGSYLREDRAFLGRIHYAVAVSPDGTSAGSVS